MVVVGDGKEAQGVVLQKDSTIFKRKETFAPVCNRQVRKSSLRLKLVLGHWPGESVQGTRNTPKCSVKF